MSQCTLRVTTLWMCDDVSHIMFEVCVKSELWNFSFKVHNQFVCLDKFIH